MNEVALVPAEPAAGAQPAAPPTLLDEIIAEGRLARQPGERERARDMIGELVDQLLDQKLRVDGDLERAIIARIAAIDAALSDQLNEVLHDEGFQRLEGTWRGLHQLVHSAETSERLKIRVLNAKKEEIHRDLTRAVEFDQSALFKVVYEAEYGTFGGAPFGVLVGDYEFGPGPQDIEMLTELAGVAAAAHAPFIAAAAPEMFNLDSFTELDQPRDLARLFDSHSYVAWRSFREQDDARYVALTLPRYLARLPYGACTLPATGFDFEEEVSGADHRRYLWSNAAYLMAQRITAAFARYGWTTAIRGVEGGGLVEGLPVHLFQTDGGEVAMKVPTEVAITDRREKELSDLGFLPLVHCQGQSYAAFFGAQTTNKPRRFLEDEATANAQLSARLPYILAVSRIAHYLKAIVRDKVGGFNSQEVIQQYLERWIAQYVLLTDKAGPAQMARKPLREARITVEEVPGRPGEYRAVAHLRPHYQLEAVNVSLRLVASLPPAAQ